MPIEAANFKPDSFNTIIMMGNNFGLFGSFEKARRLLKRFCRMTSEGALIITSSRDPYKTNNPAHLQYHKLNKALGRMSGQVRIRIRYESYIGKWFDYLIGIRGRNGTGSTRHRMEGWAVLGLWRATLYSNRQEDCLTDSHAQMLGDSRQISCS